jgi:hypothetical protein
MPSPNDGVVPVKTISLLGIPFDVNSSYLRGPAQAPKVIREEFYSGSSNLWTCGLRTVSTWDEKARFAMPGTSWSRMTTARLSRRLKPRSEKLSIWAIR